MEDIQPTTLLTPITEQRVLVSNAEEFGVAIATHLMNEYPVLTAVEVEVRASLSPPPPTHCAVPPS
eukprot:6197572-Pleurochrysis_carterae.AAC.4